MIEFVTLCMGGAIGWFSYRYQSAFVDIAAWVCLIAGILLSRNLGLIMGSREMMRMDSATLEHFDQNLLNAVPYVVAAISGLMFGMCLGRLVTHLYWRIVRDETSVVDRAETRNETLNQYGFSDPLDARLNARSRRARTRPPSGG